MLTAHMIFGFNKVLPFVLLPFAIYWIWSAACIVWCRRGKIRCSWKEALAISLLFQSILAKPIIDMLATGHLLPELYLGFAVWGGLFQVARLLPSFGELKTWGVFSVSVWSFLLMLLPYLTYMAVGWLLVGLMLLFMMGGGGDRFYYDHYDHYDRW